MQYAFIDKDHSAFLKKTNRYLLLILLIMIACFFSWSENVTITRLIKVVGRLGMLGASYYVYHTIFQYGAADNLKMHNHLSFGLYGVYLLLGFMSFLWTTNIGVSALQWFMTSQTLIFCFYFIKSLYLLDEYFPKHTIRLYNLFGDSAFFLILVFVIGMWVNPDVFFRMTHGGEEARLGGFMMNPNELGMLAGVGVAGLLFDIRRHYQFYYTIFNCKSAFFHIFL